MFGGQCLTKPICDCLSRIARQMSNTGTDRRKIVHDDCEGFVETDWESASLGDISGVVFKANIATSKGQTKAKFIVRVKDLDGLENAEWYTYEELKELMRNRAKEYEWN